MQLHISVQCRRRKVQEVLLEQEVRREEEALEVVLVQEGRLLKCALVSILTLRSSAPRGRGSDRGCVWVKPAHKSWF